MKEETKRTTIHTPPQVQRIIAGADEDMSQNARICGLLIGYRDVSQAAGVSTSLEECSKIVSALTRYRRILKQEMPALSEGEWCFLADVLNGTWLVTEVGSPADPALYLWAEASDAGADTAAKWGIDQANLVRKLREMSYAQSCGVVDVLTRFWADDHEGDYREALAKAGAVFCEPPEIITSDA